MDSEVSYSYSSYAEGGGGGGSVPVWVVVLINIVLATLTILGNFMVILAYIRDDKIRKTVAYTIILNLSITDILVGIFIFPLNTLWWINDKWAYGTIPCKLWLVLDYSVLSMSTLTIVYISLDRYWLLNMGLDYQRFQTMRKVIVVFGIAWVITVIVYLLIAFVYPIIVHHKFNSEVCELEVVKSQWFNFFEMVVQFIIPFSALVFLNFNVYKNVRERARGLVHLKYDTSDGSGIHSNTNDLDENGSTPIAKEISTTNMVTKQPSDGIELPGTEPAKDKEDIISTHSLSIVSLENDIGTTEMTTDGGMSRPASMVTTMTTDGDSRPNSGAMELVLKTVTYSPLPETGQLADAPGGDIHLGLTTKHETPIEKKRRKSHYRREKTEFRRYRKAAITLAALVTVFCICWLPYYVCAIIGSFCKSCIGYKTWEVVSYFQWCNSTINPFIYGFTNLLFRRNFIKFLHLGKLLKNKHLGTGGSSAY